VKKTIKRLFEKYSVGNNILQ